MKKLITTLLILFLSLGLFAETGYAGYEWGTPKAAFNFEEEIEEIGVKTKFILNEETDVFYSFYKNSLESVSYSITNNKTNQLLKKYPKEKKLGTVRLEQLIKEDIYKELEPEERNEKGYNIYLHYFCENISVGCDVALNQKNKGEGKCTVHIYNYNDDTKVYIFDSLVEGKTFVYYAFREQDY